MPCGQIDYHTAFYIRLSKIMLHNRNDRRASVSILLNNYTHRAKTKEQFSLDASNCSQPKRSLPHLNFYLLMRHRLNLLRRLTLYRILLEIG